MHRGQTNVPHITQQSGQGCYGHWNILLNAPVEDEATSELSNDPGDEMFETDVTSDEGDDMRWTFEVLCLDVQIK